MKFHLKITVNAKQLLINAKSKREDHLRLETKDSQKLFIAERKAYKKILYKKKESSLTIYQNVKKDIQKDVAW